MRQEDKLTKRQALLAALKDLEPDAGRKLTKRQALMAILFSLPVVAYGRNNQDMQARGFRMDVGSDWSLLELNLEVKNKANPLFLKININGKEEVRVSLSEALTILKDGR